MSEQPLPALVDIDLTEPLSPGPEWLHLPDRHIFQNRKDGRILLIPTNGVDAPSEWGLLST